MKFKIQFILLVLFFMILNVYPQAKMSFLAMNADYATFRGADSKTYTEVYLSFFQSELTYTIEDSMMIAHFSHSLRISQPDSVYYDIKRNYKNTLQVGEKVAMFNRFMDVFPLRLDPGKYDLVATLNDDVSHKIGDYRMKIEIPVYDSTLSVSDLQLATQIQKAAQASNFSLKNNMYILPNPSHVYGLLNPVLYFYFEGYNLTPDTSGNHRYSYHYYIVDDSGAVVRDFPVKEKTGAGQVIAEASGTNIIALRNDGYQLKMDLTDLNSGEIVSVSSPFTVEKPSKREMAGMAGAPAAATGGDEYSTFTKEELEDEFSKVRYIALPQERSIFENLDADGMRRFLTEFWKRRDPNPATPINEYKTTYMENVELANARYSTHFRVGWKTDRGRVLLMYGEPDEIERNPSSINTQPYEIWRYYSLDGGSDFIFGDLSGHGDYELLHSTYRNELQDPNWQQRLGGSAFNTGSQF